MLNVASGSMRRISTGNFWPDKTVAVYGKVELPRDRTRAISKHDSARSLKFCRTPASAEPRELMLEVGRIRRSMSRSAAANWRRDGRRKVISQSAWKRCCARGAGVPAASDSGAVELAGFANRRCARSYSSAGECAARGIANFSTPAHRRVDLRSSCSFLSWDLN